MSVARVGQGHMNADIRYYPVEASQTIYKGDPVVLVQEASNYNSARVKKLTQTEITANFTETNAKGLLGIALYDFVSDSSGNVSQLVPSTVEGGARATYALPSVASGLNRLAGVTEGSSGQDKGNARLGVALFNDWTEFWIRAATNSGSDASPTLANATVVEGYVGASSGIQISGVEYYADLTESSVAADAGACFVVSSVNQVDKNFNVASTLCWIRVRCIPAMQQALTGLRWTT